MNIIIKALIITNKFYWRNPEITTYNHVSFDLQWISVEEGENYLHVLVILIKNDFAIN